MCRIISTPIVEGLTQTLYSLSERENSLLNSTCLPPENYPVVKKAMKFKLCFLVDSLQNFKCKSFSQSLSQCWVHTACTVWITKNMRLLKILCKLLYIKSFLQLPLVYSPVFYVVTISCHCPGCILCMSSPYSCLLYKF